MLEIMAQSSLKDLEYAARGEATALGNFRNPIDPKYPIHPISP